MSYISEALHFQLDVTDAHPSVTPLFQCSAFSSTSPFFYSRKSNPNVVELEKVIALLEQAQYCIAYNTGMSAIYMVLDLLKPGDTLVINRFIYGCSYKLFFRLAEKRNFNVIVLDLSDPLEVARIPAETAMVFFETPTNPFLKTIDIVKISSHVKRLNSQAIIVVDNTWATPLYQKPLEHGADISIHSATKYFSGHSDVMGGVCLVNSTNLYETLMADRFYSGTIMTPYHAWLMRRSLQTLKVRLQHQTVTTKKMAAFLSELPQVRKVYYPKIDGKQLVDYGGILFIELQNKSDDAYALFRDSLRYFGTGTGMACVTSMVAQPYSGSHASMNEEEKSHMGISKSLVRLCFGLEDFDDLKNDLMQALNSLEKEYA